MGGLRTLLDRRAGDWFAEVGGSGPTAVTRKREHRTIIALRPSKNYKIQIGMTTSLYH